VNDDALLVVSRPIGWAGLAVRFRVELDGVVVGSLRPGQSVALPVPAGLHSVRATQSGSTSPTLPLDVAAGRTVTVRVAAVPGLLAAGLSGGHVEYALALTQVDPEPGADADVGVVHPDIPPTMIRQMIGSGVAVAFVLFVVVGFVVHHRNMTAGRWVFLALCLFGLAAVAGRWTLVYRARRQ
jgi:hypothetical protein